jgi:hypothetical protein
MPLDLDQRRFIRVGTDLFGNDWHGKMARMIKLSRPYVSMLAKPVDEGGRPVTDRVKAAVYAGLQFELRRIRDRGHLVKRWLREYE